jgi:hypothetical protein
MEAKMRKVDAKERRDHSKRRDVERRKAHRIAEKAKAYREEEVS